MSARQWPQVPVEELAETCSGSTPDRNNPAYYGGRIPWVKTGELRDDRIVQTEEFVSEQALQECSLRVLPPETLLIAMYGQGQTRGRTSLLAVPAATNQACFAVLPNLQRFLPRFLQYWFRANYGRLRKETENRGGSQPNLNGVFLRRLSVTLPPLVEQRSV